jgi:hypothetical protein
MPVTSDASSDSNHRAATATSSGVPSRLLGCICDAQSTSSGFASKERSTIAVRMTPGSTALTRMPRAA